MAGGAFKGDIPAFENGAVIVVLAAGGPAGLGDGHGLAIRAGTGELGGGGDGCGVGRFVAGRFGGEAEFRDGGWICRLLLCFNSRFYDGGFVGRERLARNRTADKQNDGQENEVTHIWASLTEDEK